ncbi:MAG: lipocalin-like domain-containing protein [Muribaculaceae bacterium]|nr:lipocalin-like domain-containing protein [Muribaculaceae bacterium]
MVVVPILFSGCQKAPINGDLDGQWEVMEVTPPPVEIVIDQRLFYNFNLHTCDLTYYGALFTQGNMRYDGETLWLEFPFSSHENFDLTLLQYGIHSNPVTFNVNFTDSHHLTLYNEDSTVVLIKH